MSGREPQANRARGILAGNTVARCDTRIFSTFFRSNRPVRGKRLESRFYRTTSAPLPAPPLVLCHVWITEDLRGPAFGDATVVWESHDRDRALERIRAAYAAENFDKLRVLKPKCDLENL